MVTWAGYVRQAGAPQVCSAGRLRARRGPRQRRRPGSRRWGRWPHGCSTAANDAVTSGGCPSGRGHLPRSGEVFGDRPWRPGALVRPW